MPGPEPGDTMSTPTSDDTTATSGSMRADDHAAEAPVLIAGGGIGGLAAALALARRGIASHVLERRAAFAEDGAGIQIGPNGTRILIELGVAEALKPHAGMPAAIRVRDGTSGKVLARLPLGPWIAERHGAPYWVAHRANLHNALHEAAQKSPLVSLTMDFAVNEVVAGAQTVTVSDGLGKSETCPTETGRTETGRALIAADGIWSTIRSRDFHASPPRFAGKSAARAVLPIDAVPAALRKPETALWLFPDAHVVHYPVSGGRELAIVVIVADTMGGTEWSTPAAPDWVDKRLPPCAAPLRELIAQAPGWKTWALQDVAMPQAWARGRIALLGDAAHPVFPFLAQGGVLALEDAVVLAEAVAQYPHDVIRALASYARRRRPRAQRVIAASRQNGRIYHMSGLAARARNLVLRTVAPELLMGRYDWLYGWRPELDRAQK
jgi:2-polyprenyl-6-methoxyphenol hydroxylase-like FAD-dependent oxidoreductase